MRHTLPFAAASLLVVPVLSTCAAAQTPIEAGDGAQAACADAPAFAATTEEPVLLRYALKRNQRMRMELDMDTRIQMGVGTQTLDVGRETMRFEAQARVTGVDDQGNISLLVTITRMRMKMTGMVDVEFDSDQAHSDNPAFEGVKAMIGVGIPCRVSPIGEMLETDLEPLRLAVRRANNAALGKALEGSASKMFEGTFVQLSEQPIAAGQSYEAGTIVSDQMKARVSYAVVAVNNAKTRVLMKPEYALELSAGAFPNADVNVVGTDVSGWLLFDIERGFAREGAVCTHVLTDLSANGQTMQMGLTMNMRAVSTLE